MGDLVHGKVYEATAKHQHNLKKGQGTAGQLTKKCRSTQKMSETLGEGQRSQRVHALWTWGYGLWLFPPAWLDHQSRSWTHGHTLSAIGSGQVWQGVASKGASLSIPPTSTWGSLGEEKNIPREQGEITEDMLQDFVA